MKPHIDEAYQQFRFGSRLLTALGTQVDHVHTNVFRLSINNGSLDNILLKFFFCLPVVIQKWAKPYAPEWFLPPTIICKKQKAENAELFINEKNMYMRLHKLQGTVIPIFYGEVTCADGAPCLLLSDIGGNVLCSPDAAGISEGLLKDLLGKVFNALAIYNIAYDDIKLDNFLLVGRNRIMVIDLEMAEEREPGDVEFFNNSSIRHLCLAYQRHQEVLRFDGLLRVDGSQNALLAGFRAVASLLSRTFNVLFNSEVCRT